MINGIIDFIDKLFKTKKHKRRHKHGHKNGNSKADELKKLLKKEKDKEKRAEMLEKMLDNIAAEVNSKGGVNGIDGETFAVIMSYYLEDDKRYKKIIDKVLKKRKM